MTFRAMSLVVTVLLAGNADAQDKTGFTIHIRPLTEPERVVRKSLTDQGTVIEAIGTVKDTDVAKMDMWLVRKGKDGKPAILRIDWAGITKQGRTETNFLLQPGDRIMLQERWAEDKGPKRIGVKEAQTIMKTEAAVKELTT